jgi:hypothetical protein
VNLDLEQRSLVSKLLITGLSLFIELNEAANTSGSQSAWLNKSFCDTDEPSPFAPMQGIAN